MICIIHIDAPTSPVNISHVVNSYHVNYSTAVVSWDPPTGDTLVDYYQYQLITDTEPIHTLNVTDTAFTLSGVSYNENITIVLSAINCAGTSDIIVYTLTIGTFSRV